MDIEKLPSFSWWKVLYEVIVDLVSGDLQHSTESVEISVKKLTKDIIQSKSKDFFKTVVYIKENPIEFEEFQYTIECYQVFTTWILGQFFYLTGYLENSLIIEAQIHVLDVLTKSYPHIYNALIKEYVMAFDMLVNYYKTPQNQNLVLTVFVPKDIKEFEAVLDLKPKFFEVTSKEVCVKFLQKVLKCFKFILPESVILYNINESVYKTLNHILLLLCDLQFITEILDIFIEIVDRLNYHINDWSNKFLAQIQSFFSIFEQVIFDYYNKTISMEINNPVTFEQLLIKYFKVCNNLKRDLGQNVTTISVFLINLSLKSNLKNYPSYEIQNVAVQTVVSNQNVSFLQSNREDMIQTIIEKNNFVIFKCFKLILYTEISEILEIKPNIKEINVFESHISKTWSVFSRKIIEDLGTHFNESNSCDICGKINFLNSITVSLYDICLMLRRNFDQTTYTTIFFREDELLINILSNILQHNERCNCIDISEIFRFMVNFVFLTNSKNIDIIFCLTCSPYLIPSCFKNENNLPVNFIGATDLGKCKAVLKKFYSYLLNVNWASKKKTSLEFLTKLLMLLSSGVSVNLNLSYVEQIEVLYTKILKAVKEDSDKALTIQVIDSIPHVFSIFSASANEILQIYVSLYKAENVGILEKLVEILPYIICICTSDYLKVLDSDEDKNIEFFCSKCFKIKEGNSSDDIQIFLEKRYQTKAVFGVFYSKSSVDFALIENSLLKYVLKFLGTNSLELKLKSIDTLPCFSQHVPLFSNNTNITKLWIELAGDKDIEVRKRFVKVVRLIIEFTLDNPDIPEEIKKGSLEIIFTTLLRITKKSLQFSEYDNQDTLISTIEKIGLINKSFITLQCVKILLYLVMIPTSKYSFVAINKCIKLTGKEDLSKMKTYIQNPKELCEVIIHLCCVNKELINYTLVQSLDKVSVMLGYFDVKEYVTEECQNLLPFLVVKVVKKPMFADLITEISHLTNTKIADLFSQNYGNIFLHIFLDLDPKTLKECVSYLEKNLEESGPSLRKKNLRVILNELLINFHKKHEKVILALDLLTREDPEKRMMSIPDYLQSTFLGVLQHFDIKLTSAYSEKNEVLLSLASLFTFMGSKHIMSTRYKIIAMLQTTDYSEHPSLNCDVWSAFIHSCDVEVLGPHLATIFVSVWPLMEYCPQKVNELVKYLIVENEMFMSDNIPDLFFVSNNVNLDGSVLNVIEKYVRKVDNCKLKEKIVMYLRYLNHETIEVRVQALRQLKVCLSESREELDQMILGYNGIDDVIVELIDSLTLGCREKDKRLIMACGEVFGELGAVEPSHLPRRYNQDNQQFTFFIDEDSFAVKTLNELTKAFQTYKNSREMDRVSLAIQEILKTYDISPNESSKNHVLWSEFPESQRQVMLPFLSSRYKIIQNISPVESPVYGSNFGTSFDLWLHSFACNLISTLPDSRKLGIQEDQKIHLPEERNKFFLMCMPSFKDTKIFMYFLPYILLHALLEGNDRNETAFIEFQTVMKSFNRKKTLDLNALNQRRPLPIAGIAPCPSVITPEEVKQIQCTNAVFLLLDFLDRWLREWQWEKGLEGITDNHYIKIKRFKERFSKLDIAKCNYKCGEYPRALMYLEEYITENQHEISTHLPFLAEIYAQLEEADGVAGVEPLQKTEPSLEQTILALEVAGKLADAAACYERIARPLQLQQIQGLVQCYLDLDKVNTALYFAQGALDMQPQFGNVLWEMQAEPLWRLGQYEDLDMLVKKTEMVESNCWGVQIGRSLLHLKNGNHAEFKSVMEALTKLQVEHFGASSLEEGAYQHGYSYISRLHCLNELQQVESAFSELLLKPNDNNSCERIMKKLMNEWELRLKVVQVSVRSIEPLLCMRRVALELGKQIAEEKVPQAVPFFNTLLGECWLQSVKIARAAGVQQQAYTYTLNAENYAPPKLFLEKAKLHWLRQEHEEALITLRRGLGAYIPEDRPNPKTVVGLDLEQRKICAEARLLIAKYNDSICSVDYETNLQQYKEAVEVYREWEKSFVCLAQYYDRIFQNYSNEEKDAKGSDIQLHMINFFGKSLKYGTKYVYQSLPRILSLWFDYGTRLLDVTSGAIKEERRNTLFKMTKLIDALLEQLPAYVFLTAFSQIVSRICHGQKEVYIELRSIILKLLTCFPQQCLWMLSSVIKSSYPIRSRRCAEILNDPRIKSNGAVSRLVNDFTSLAEKLIELCNREIPPDVNSTKVSSLLRTLPRMLMKDGFSEIMMPTHKLRKLILSNPDFKSSQHNPFPNQNVYIVGIEDEVTILASLQRPRKITLRGSDGKRYIFMLKPKDDLRKDFRLMEFNDIVNQLLLREADARQRRLNIRLYSVAPLNEECGLIEWVPNLIGYRPILMALYKQRGLGMKARELKDLCCNIKDPLAKKREIFTKHLLPKHPPVLGEWFRKTFPDAQSWLTARTAYTRTTAVMSVAGYVLGLGDRHGENILLDSTCGDLVHVDFNCLFNKGETFEWPERVPFRLTQNMVAAMGPLGVEGVFRKSCECTVRVLRSHANTLMSIVTPFVYDPLVSWPRNAATSSVVAQSTERTNTHAVDHIKNIELRLQGIVKTRSRTLSIPLSVEGQTDYLITEAMSIDNLCQMYIGWGPYL